MKDHNQMKNRVAAVSTIQHNLVCQYNRNSKPSWINPYAFSIHKKDLFGM